MSGHFEICAHSEVSYVYQPPCGSEIASFVYLCEGVLKLNFAFFFFQNLPVLAS